MSNSKRIQFEFGDAILWVTVGGSKPFPTSLTRKGNVIDFQIHSSSLKNSDRKAVESFLLQRADEIKALWPDAFNIRLNFPLLGENIP